MASTITAGNATNNGTSISSDNTGILEIKTGTGSGTTAMTLNASANVGIGTASPAVPLDIYNATTSSLRVQGDSTVNAQLARYSTDNQPAVAIIRKGRGTVASPSAVASGDVMGQLVFQAFGGTNNRSLAAISGVVSAYTSDTDISSYINFSTTPTGSVSAAERMRIDSSGTVGIGITSANGFWGSTNTDAKVNIAYSSSGTTFDTAIKGLVLQNTNTTTNNTTSLIFGSQNTGGTGIAQAAIYSINGTRGAGFNSGQLGFSYANSSGVLTEAMRIDSSGNLLVGCTVVGVTQVGFNFAASTTTPSVNQVLNTAGTANSYHLFNLNATNTGYRFYVQVNGGIANFSGNNVNISDARLKTDIAQAGNYLDKICAIPVRTFKYKDQGEDQEKTLGVIAQEVEAIAPELVNNDGFGDMPEDGVPLKTIYQTDLQYALMKCIQELKAELDVCKAELDALKGAK